MKKNAMLKIAAILMVAVLLTTCAISSTFAKYVTNGTGSDEARVAKFGISVTADALGMFAESYNSNKIKSLTTGEKVLAPGASGNFNLGSALSGSAEVDVKVTYKTKVTISDTWFIDTNTFYCPIEVTVGTNDPINGREYTSAADFIAAVEAAMVNATGAEIPAGTDLDALYADDAQLTPEQEELKAAIDAALALNVSWEWDFEASGNDNVKALADANDTKLGAKAAAGTDLTIRFDVTIDVTQVN